MYCTMCGKENPADNEFCQYCGTKLESGAHAPTPTHQSAAKRMAYKKNLWKPALIIIAVLGVIGWLAYDNGGSSLVGVGDYWCSDAAADEADSRAPNTDYSDEIARWNALGDEIEAMMVDESSSDELIDSYNAKIDEYNDWSDSIDARITSTEGSVEQYNQSVAEYNAYLEANCDPR